MICRNSIAAIGLCLIEFAPGTWTVQIGSTHAYFRIQRGGRVVAHGTLTLRRGTTTRRPIGGLRRGRYTLIITLGQGRRHRVQFRRAFTVGSVKASRS